MQTILLTGASGFLGKAIQKKLISRNTKIVTIGRKSSNTVLCDLSLDQPNIPFNTIDLVIHCAGKAHLVPNSNIEKNLFFEVNVKGTKNLLEALETLTLAPLRFVYISSVSVYGRDIGEKINENEKLLASDPYGLSKLKAETLVLNWCEDNNVICTILRLPLLVGDKPPGNLGKMLRMIKKGMYFNVGGGFAKKSMVLAEDVAKFIPQISKYGGIYNLSDGEHPSFNEIASAISKNKIFNIPIYLATIIGFIGDFFGRNFPVNSSTIKKMTSNLTFDDSKARKMGWKPNSVKYYINNNLKF